MKGQTKNEWTTNGDNIKIFSSDAHIDATMVAVKHEQINVPQTRIRWNSHIHSHTGIIKITHTQTLNSKWRE